jgi:DNA-binding transcriptional MerR regulator
MPAKPLPVYEHLALVPFGIAEAAMAAGMPVARLAARIKEGRVPSYAKHAVGSGRRRRFSLTEIYGLRIIETLTTSIGMPVADATAILDALRGADLAPDLAVFQTRYGFAPHEWPKEWRWRDLTRPYIFAARRRGDGVWDVRELRLEETLADNLFAIGGKADERMIARRPTVREIMEHREPDQTPGPPMGLAVFNLTRELVAVDVALAAELGLQDAALAEQFGLQAEGSD